MGEEMGEGGLRTGGFAPIGGYGLIGDGRSAALVAADGAVDWWAVPAMDSPPIFAAVLDPGTGGVFTLEPAVPYRTERRYVPDTNVLETTFITGGGHVRVTDAVNRSVDGLLAWAELARQVQADAGEVPMRWRVAPGTRFGRSRPWAWRDGQTPLLRAGDQTAALVTDGTGDPRAGLGDFSGEFIARPGRDALLALAVTDGEPVAVPSAAEVRERLRRTGEAWRRWCGSVRYDGPDREMVLRSAMVLKLLAYAPTGALISAPTTSLPERIGGERNFDYRYGWVRDTSFALDALIRLGLPEEAHDTLSWLLGAITRTAPDIRALYTLAGPSPTGQTELDVRGYRDSRPVHDGNGAASQPQWGNYGDLLECVWLAVDRGGTVLDARTARMLETMAERVCDLWALPDSGIWELGTKRHYTISKLGCWAALDRMVRLADRGQIVARDADRWQAEQGAIRRWVDENCWSPAKRSYTFYAGSDELDASLLLAGRTGFCSGGDPRFAQTIDAIRAELADGPLVYRYSGSWEQEGTFVACSFWLADALVRTGRADAAREIWDGMTAHANDLGLLSEEFDPHSAELRGNMPQALSHLALVTAACQLRDAGQRAGARNDGLRGSAAGSGAAAAHDAGVRGDRC